MAVTVYTVPLQGVLSLPVTYTKGTSYRVGGGELTVVGDTVLAVWAQGSWQRADIT